MPVPVSARPRGTDPALIKTSVRNWIRMTETTKNSGEKLSVAPSKTLTLKRPGVEQGMVRQSFSHGRSKAVVVEKVKRRVGPGEAKPEPAAAAPAAAPKRAGAPAPSRNTAPAQTQSAAPTAAPKSSGV